MARANSGLGCLGTLIILWPFWWAYDSCTGGEQRRAAQQADAEARASAQRIAENDAAERARVQELERKKAERELARDAARTETERIAKLKPYERAALLAKCVKDSDCPLGLSDPDVILDAAKTDGERKQLEAAVPVLERARERIERAQARTDAPLLCCDGSGSPSCTCGNPHRGCCSHHGGVCGCTADQ
jgi:hypothetical protein